MSLAATLPETREAVIPWQAPSFNQWRCFKHAYCDELSISPATKDSKRVAARHPLLVSSMSSNDVNGSSRRDAKRRRFELFFWEKVGTHYHLRFTRLALVLVVCLTVIPAAAIFAIFFTQSRVDFQDVNINMRGEPRAPGNYNHIIPAPPPPMLPTPKVSRSPRGVEPIWQPPAAPNVNANAPLTTSPTPTPTPPRSPG